MLPMSVTYGDSEAVVSARCYRSMKKNEAPHSLKVIIGMQQTTVSGKCSCVAGAGGICHHVVGLLFYLAHCKQLGLNSLPDDLTCTMMSQRWSVPRGKHISPQCVDALMVKKPREGANYDKFIKSTLYSPASQYHLLGPEQKAKLKNLNPEPLLWSLLPDLENLAISQLPSVQTKFGAAPKGSVLSYQQRLTEKYVINDYAHTSFPKLPLPGAGERFENNVSICLDNNKSAKLESLSVTLEMAHNLEEKTREQNESDLWHSLRKKRITASKFGIVAKRISNFDNLVKQLQPSRLVQTAAMKRGIEMEGRAASIYATKAKQGMVNLYPSGLVINPKCPWLGSSPDRKVYDVEAAQTGLSSPYGLFETKVVQEGTTSLDDVAYLKRDPISNELTLNKKHLYYLQVQCQLGTTGLDWCDFFCYINDDLFFCQRIVFDPAFFQECKDKVDLFYFNYFL